MWRASTFYQDEHRNFQQTLRRFVDTAISPYVETWEEAGEFPRGLYQQAAAVGLLGLGFPAALGGTPTDAFYELIACEELARPGSGGVAAGLGSHTIALPPLVHLGSEVLQQRIIPPTLRGERIAALAVTEPQGGSDVAQLSTRAVRDGDHYVVDGQKTFITSGMRADFLTVAVRTGEPGPQGLSLLLIETDRPGIQRTLLKKMGWWASDTASIFFDACRVPCANLVGEANQGFMGMMLNFNQERFHLAAHAYGFACVCYEEALAWAKERVTFGRPLVARQVIRHKLVDMAMQLTATRAFLERVALSLNANTTSVAEMCMLKNHATQTLELCAKEAVQILGGAGYMRGCKSERIYRETKVIAIGGGAEEIMKDLAAKQLGF